MTDTGLLADLGSNTGGSLSSWKGKKLFCDTERNKKMNIT